MTPADLTRCWRKGLRKARRGVPTGRRATHQAKTTYGHRQRERDRRAAWDGTPWGGASDIGLPDGAVYGPAPDAAVTVTPEWWRP